MLFVRDEEYIFFLATTSLWQGTSFADLMQTDPTPWKSPLERQAPRGMYDNGLRVSVVSVPSGR